MPADKSLKDLSNAVYRIAENSPKIQKDVKDIRDAVCGTEGILESLHTIGEKIDGSQKKDVLSRTSGRRTDPGLNTKKILRSTNSITSLLKKILGSVDSISSKGGRNRRLHAENFRRDDDRRIRNVKGLESLSKSIDIVERLRNIKLKDFIFAKRKMNNISKIFFRALNMFRHFKNQKEVDGTLGLVDSSIDIMKKLKKAWFISKPAQWGEKAIEKILLGGKKNPNGGLLGIFRKLSKNERHIRKGKRSIREILVSCNSMLLISMLLTGIAVVGIPAMLGALVLKGVMWLLVGTYKYLGKSGKTVLKGTAVLLLMSTSIITFALGLGLMAKATKNMSWKQFGMMMASIGALGATMVVLGIPVVAALAALGSSVLLLMGASLGIFALSLLAWNKVDAKPAMNNIKIAVNGLKEVFGLDSNKNEGEKKPFIKRLAGGVMDIAMAVLNFGKMFFTMGSLLLAGAALGLLYKGIRPWSNFDGRKAAGNIRTTINVLKDVFGLNEVKGGISGKLKGLGGGILDMGISILQGGKAFVQLGTIVIATAMMDIVRLTMIPWVKDFDSEKAAHNMKTAVGALKDVFGLDERDGQSFKSKIKGAGSDLIGLASSLLQMGSVFNKMGAITMGTAMMGIIRRSLKKWENYDASNAIGNMSNAVKGLSDCFGLREPNQGIKETALGMVSDLLSLGSNFIKMGDTFFRMGSLLIATGAMGRIKKNLVEWEDYKPGKSIENIRFTVDSLLDVFGITGIQRMEDEIDNDSSGKFGKVLGKIGNALAKPFELATSLADTAVTAAEGGKAMLKMSSILNVTSTMATIKGTLESWETFDPTKSLDPFNKSIRSVNTLDIEKASIMIELFKSFTNIKQKPFDKFTMSVNKFSESCAELIEALNNFNGNNINSVEITDKNNDTVITRTENVNINNPESLAQAIAKAIKSLPINVETNMSDIRLVVDGVSGKKVVLSLE